MRIGYRSTTARTLSLLVFSLAFSSVPRAIAEQFGTPNENEGTRIFSPLNIRTSGQFHLSGQRTTLIGSVNDRTPWDHLDYAGKRLTPVQSTIDGGPAGQISVMQEVGVFAATWLVFILSSEERPHG